MAGDNKTEKATPKRREEARKKGQVARSADLSGGFVMLVSVLALGASGPHILSKLSESFRTTLALTANSDSAVGPGLGHLMSSLGMTVLEAVAPVALAAMLSGIVINAAQVRPKLTPSALKPKPAKLNPLKGAKQVFGPNALFEGGKTIFKMLLIGAVAAIAVVPSLPQMASLVGLTPAELLGRAGTMVLSVFKRGAIAYLLIGAVDYAWQRHRHEKSIKMDKEEVKREAKDQNVSPEVKAAIRRRAMAAARRRMMAAVPTADVVVTNPTHFAVALKYSRGMDAPEVVAKGQDLVALQIRRIAAEHSVPTVPDPPLARSLHATVEVGQQIPEELYAAVAQVLAFVYRTASRRAV